MQNVIKHVQMSPETWIRVQADVTAICTEVEGRRECVKLLVRVQELGCVCEKNASLRKVWLKNVSDVSGHEGINK